jgi:hypothetical protein
MGNTAFDKQRKQHKKFIVAQPPKEKEKKDAEKRIKILDSSGALMKLIVKK